MRNNILNGNWKQLLIIVILSCLTVSVSAQDEPAANQGPSDAEKAKANNPLADVIAFNVQYYYRPNLNEVTGGQANTNWYRLAVPTGRILWRFSMPIESRIVNNETTNFSEVGFGDLDIFAAYNIVQKPGLSFGIGPNITFNTASRRSLGSGGNSLGVAAVTFITVSPQFQTGALVIWKTDVWGPDDRDSVNLLALQPFFIWQLGKGLYFRSVPIIPIDLDSGEYHVPLGVGIGKVMKVGSTVFNFFVEPQPSIAFYGAGQPTFQIYAAINMQFSGKKK